MADLCGAVKRAVADGPIGAGSTVPCNSTRIRAAVNAASLPDPSNSGWASCKWSQIRTMLLARFNCLWTARRALLFKCPGANGGNCPLCNQPDSVGHLLGACRFKPVHAAITARHNAAVNLVRVAMLDGALGASYTVMDACPDAARPEGVASTRVPSWLLCGELASSRPDLLVVAELSYVGLDGAQTGLPAVPALPPPRVAAAPPVAVDGTIQAQDLPPWFLADAAARCVVHVLELTCTFEGSSTWAARIAAKQDQHVELCAALVHAGWTVRSHVLPIGSAGTIFEQCETSVNAMGIHGARAKRLFRDLHLLAVRTATSLATMRRKLTGTAAARAVHPGAQAAHPVLRGGAALFAAPTPQHVCLILTSPERLRRERGAPAASALGPPALDARYNSPSERLRRERGAPAAPALRPPAFADRYTDPDRLRRERPLGSTQTPDGNRPLLLHPP